jgi:hypothetical protein
VVVVVRMNKAAKLSKLFEISPKQRGGRERLDKMSLKSGLPSSLPLRERKSKIKVPRDCPF